MFGYIISGQPVKTDFETVSETQVLFNLGSVTASHINIVVFATSPFPESYGGAIYFNWPNPEPTWQYLGYICNNKPSAIFRVAQIKQSSGTSNIMFGSTASSQPQLGISALPLKELEQLVVANDNTQQTISSNVLFVQKMLESLYNYCSSFAITQQQMTRSPETFVTLSTIEKWYDKFKTKFQHDPNFWKK